MFHSVLLDLTTSDDPRLQRLFSCLKFVADEAKEVVFYINDSWSNEELASKCRKFYNELPTELRPTYLSELKKIGVDIEKFEATDMPKIAYIINSSWESDGFDKVKFKANFVEREFVASKSAVVNRGIFLDRGVHSNTALLLLASVGIDILLPNVSFELKADEEIECIKNELLDERLHYLEAISNLANASYEGLKSSDLSELIRWADSEINIKLVPKARVLERRLSLVSKKRLKNSGYSVWKDGVPAVASSFFSGGLLSAGLSSAEVALRKLVSSIGASEQEKTVPEIGYVLALRRRLNG